MTACLGIDTGGTFTDFVLLEPDRVRTHKVLSSPDAPEEAILLGVREMGLEQAMHEGELVIVHGTTVATNAVLEGRGGRTVFVTNSGTSASRKTPPSTPRVRGPLSGAVATSTSTNGTNSTSASGAWIHANSASSA